MKKQLLWCALALLTGFTSCKKENGKQESTNSENASKLKTNVAQPTYYYSDLTLQPRQQGENFDTYKGVWSGEEIKMIGTPVWNYIAFPNLVNGIPALGASYGTYSNADGISVVPGAGQDFFILSIGQIVIPNLTAFQSDVNSYDADRNTYEKNVARGISNATPPLVYNYIKDSYVNATNPPPVFRSVTGKLIRVTTGSHWAIATIDYPTPAPAAPVAPRFVGAVPDPTDNTIVYDIYGSNGNITSVKKFQNGIEQNMAGGFGTGSYTLVQANIYHVITTIYKSNGVTFQFTGNLDIS